MKHEIHAVALALALACAAAPAFAGDDAKIAQGGSTSTAAITQSANSGNISASISQGIQGPGAGNIASIVQDLVSSDTFATIVQGGDNNEAHITQRESEFTGATVSQAGNNNFAAINQLNDHISFGEITQAGDGNRASISHNAGIFTTGRVTQTGNANFASLTQDSTVRVTAVVTQQGDANAAYVTQADYTDSPSPLALTQIGNGNVAVIRQSGLLQGLRATVNGDNNRTNIEQQVGEADVQTDQFGHDNVVNVTQIGSPVAVISQAGSFNTANVWQQGADLSASIMQSTSSSYNTASIYQSR